jgi:DNA-directed RNA polymerase subunit RPC12/RpoP
MAQWIEEYTEIKCPECGQEFTDEVCCGFPFGWPWHYCPKCGAQVEVNNSEVV